MKESLKVNDTVEITQGGLYAGSTGTLRRLDCTPTGQARAWEVRLSGCSWTLWVPEYLLRRIEVTP